jgi:hypothetical protein
LFFYIAPTPAVAQFFSQKVRFLLNILIKFSIIPIAIEMADLPAVRLAGSGEPQVIVSADTRQNNR